MQGPRTGGGEARGAPTSLPMYYRGGEDRGRRNGDHGLARADARSSSGSSVVTPPRAFGGVCSGSFASGIGIGGGDGLVGSVVAGALGGVTDFILFVFGRAEIFHHGWILIRFLRDVLRMSAALLIEPVFRWLK